MDLNVTSAVAIVGLGCRFPGGGDTPQAFWSFLTGGGDAIVDVPADRWNSDRFHAADPSRPGKTYMRKGGFLSGPVDRFDPLFFGISPREALYMDPQQRMLLEVAWEAMEEGGFVPGDYVGSPTGVYVGGFAMDSMNMLMSPLNRPVIDTHHAATAASLTMLAARLSYIFDFRGPSVALDTACSSSLVALHYACQGLIARECDLALAGGVNLMLSPQYPMVMSKGHYLASDGRSKSFDASADGYGRGEGCGLVVLKRLDEALRDGDVIHAVVRGTGVNQDGRTDGISVPSASAQEALIRDVHARAGVPLSAVRYVEAHGTGTAVGDPIEASALARTFGTGRDSANALIVGSVKANIGHLEAAAGVAGLIKACLVLKHGLVPRQINIETPNPEIPFAEWGLRLPLETTPLPAGEDVLFAAINSFGYGGTNAHAILSAAPAPDAAPMAAAPSDAGPIVLPISAKSEAALRALAHGYAARLEGAASSDARAIAWTAALHRSQFDHRLAVVGESAAEITEGLRAFLDGTRSANVIVERRRAGAERRPVFVFSGMGPQWWGMGQTLLEREPVFRATAEAIDEAFRQVAGWSMLEEMRRPESLSRMAETSVAQPANFVLQVALAALLAHRGVEPCAIVGHSVGEVAAAHVAGALGLDDAVRVVFHRSRLQQTTAGTGTMLAVGLGAEQATEVIEPHRDVVAIAAVNSPRAVTLAGREDALKVIADGLAAEGVFHRFLQVEVPYHSPLMEPLRGEMLASLAGLTPRTPTTPLFSTVTGRPWGAAERHDAAYWYANLREPVLFADAVRHMAEAGHQLFVEIGPNPVLSSSIKDIFSALGADGDAVYSLRRSETEGPAIARLVGRLHAMGVKTDWHRVLVRTPGRATLPAYPWQRERYWLETPLAAVDRLGASLHPLLGTRQPVAPPTFTAEINSNYAPWLADHRIDDAVVFPGAGYVEAFLAAHAAIEGSEPAIVADLKLSQALVLDMGAGAEMQWRFDPLTRACTASSRLDPEGTSWQPHASADVLAAAPWAAEPRDYAALAARLPQTLEVGALYAALDARGLCYGPAFRCVRALRRGPGEVLADLALAEAEAAKAGAYRLHPALLDAAFQSLIAGCGEEDGTLFMPVSIRQIRYHAPTGVSASVHGRLTKVAADAIEGDLVLFGADGTVMAEVQGLRCIAVGNAKPAGLSLGRLTYAYAWEPAEPATAFADDARWLLLGDPDVGPVLARYLAGQGAEAVFEAVEGDRFERLSDHRFALCRDAADDLSRLFDAIGLDRLRGIVDLRALAAEEGGDPAGQGAVAATLALVQAIGEGHDASPRLYVVTRGAAQVVPGERVAGYRQAALAGFIRGVAVERPDLKATMVDIDPVAKPMATARRLGAELLSGSEEDDVALRGSDRFVHRIRRAGDAPADVAGTLPPDAVAGLERAFRLEASAPGSIERLQYRETVRRVPGVGEVELRIRATALNFKDVLKVLNVLPKAALDNTYHGESLGMEAAAVVSAVGPGVTAYAVGDEIVTSVPGCLASHVLVKAEDLFALPRAAGHAPAEAATVPVAFLTAYYALAELARLRRGETVLIHAATGGVGLAAIQVAQWLGATIFATAGSPEKRALLKRLGVAQVWDSRSLEFAEGIRQVTGGRGVDVVLNSLSGEALRHSFASVASFGRFVEIGKRDIMENGGLPMLAFNENLSFHSVDLDRLMVERASEVRRLFGEVWERMRAGDFKPLPTTVFPAAKVGDALRFMAQAKQIGKIVVDFEARQDLDVIALAARPEPVRADRTYLVTGGFGGFGGELVRDLARRGARTLVVASRGGAASESARRLMDDLAAQGVAVRAAALDIADRSAVRALVAEIGAGDAPLGGVFHAAAVLDDALIANLDAGRIARAMGAKALGAVWLHEETRHLRLDHFVLFSSAIGMIGNPGQAGYAAANAVLDALALDRHALGLPATSVAWGAIGDAGMLAEDNQAARQLQRAGVSKIPVSVAVRALFEVMRQERGVVGLMDVDWTAWQSLFPATRTIPRFAALAGTAPGASAAGGYGAELAALPARERLDALTVAVTQLVADALHVGSDKIDRHQPLTDLGIDSLVAVELQSAIGEKLGLQISILQLIKGGTILDMAKLLLKKLKLDEADPDPVAAKTEAREAA